MGSPCTSLLVSYPPTLLQTLLFCRYGVTHCHSLMHEDGKMGGQKGV